MDMVPSGDGGDAYLCAPRRLRLHDGHRRCEARGRGRVPRQDRHGLPRRGPRRKARRQRRRHEVHGEGGLIPATLAFVKRSPSGDARYAFLLEGSGGPVPRQMMSRRELDGEPGFIMFGSISMARNRSRRRSRPRLPGSPGPTRSTRAREAPSPASIPISGRPHSGTARATSAPSPDGSLSAIVKASSEDIEWLYPDLSEEATVERMLGSGPELVVVTRGPQGALAATKREKAEAEGMAVEVADTIGAGDTFHAALLFLLDRDGVRTRQELRSLDATRLRSMLAFANAAAAADCTRAGAQPPYLAEVEGYLSK